MPSRKRQPTPIRGGACILILALLGLASWSCKTSNLNNIKVTEAYDPEADFSQFRFFAFHLNDSVSRIFYQINTGGLLYQKELTDTAFTAHLQLRIETFDSHNPKEIFDSLTINITDIRGYQKQLVLTDSVDLRLKPQGKFYLQFEIIDLNRRTKTADGGYIEHGARPGKQDFMLRDKNSRPVFDNYLKPGQPCYLYTLTCKDPRLFVRQYRQEYPIALAPFVEIRAKDIVFKSDSTFFIEMESGASSFLEWPEKGIYFVQSDTSLAEGYAVFRFQRDFPEVATPDQMRFPLRYICSKNEFNDLMMMKNAKEAIDEFWLKRSDNPDRAKELIRKYYTRVRYANQYFTSYHEGWKTDRGMLYIILGPPTLVYRNPDRETWIYGEDRNFLSTTYIFQKSNNRFSENDYILDRSQEYKDLWYDAVQAWRQ